ncbi:MAG: hypothetical protein J3K34DRAFT_411601 [Monoraphidium minutum]|nr:MAG: hypothetical protein J3K34DRAFT_411601 [Monoraphidium minutum]
MPGAPSGPGGGQQGSITLRPRGPGPDRQLQAELCYFRRGSWRGAGCSKAARRADGGAIWAVAGGGRQEPPQKTQGNQSNKQASKRQGQSSCQTADTWRREYSRGGSALALPSAAKAAAPRWRGDAGGWQDRALGGQEAGAAAPRRVAGRNEAKRSKVKVRRTEHRGMGRNAKAGGAHTAHRRPLTDGRAAADGRAPAMARPSAPSPRVAACGSKTRGRHAPPPNAVCSNAVARATAAARMCSPIHVHIQQGPPEPKAAAQGPGNPGLKTSAPHNANAQQIRLTTSVTETSHLLRVRGRASARTAPGPHHARPEPGQGSRKQRRFAPARRAPLRRSALRLAHSLYARLRPRRSLAGAAGRSLS